MHFFLAASAACAAFISSASSLAIAEQEDLVARGSAAGWSYYGCVELPPFAEISLIDEGDMTRQLCASYCQNKNYEVAGLSEGSDCYCWHGSNNKYSPLDETKCNLACTGDAQDTCGGHKALSILNNANQSSPKELRSMPARKRKCGGAKYPVSSSSEFVLSPVPSATTTTTISSSSTPSTSSSMIITSASSDPESTSSVSSETSSSNIASTTSSALTSSGTVSDVFTSTSSADQTTSEIPSTTSSEVLTTSDATTTISSSSVSETGSSDAATTSSSSISDTTSSDIATSTSSSTTLSEVTTTSSSSVSERITSDATTSITSTTTSETPTSATVTGPCATITGSFVLLGSGTGDFSVDGNFVQLQSAFGSGYRTSFSAARQNAQQFRFNGDCTLSTSDGGLLAMIGGTANLHYQYFFPSVQEAAALVNVNWEADVCKMNADTTLTCTAMEQSIFQVTPGDPLLEIGDQLYGEQVTINLIPVLNVPV